MPLVDEPGLEFIPGTHKRWHSDEALDVRLGQNGRQHYEDLPAAVSVIPKPGDVLVFSANMIRRGIYGLDRLSLDILFCDPVPELVTFVDGNCLPDQSTLARRENRTAFDSAIDVKANNKVMGVPTS
jgi:hypothetical protein